MSSRTRPEKKQSSEPPSLITSLPDDVIVDILARVPRCNYLALSLVSKHFRSIVSSDELYARRSLLGCTEACVYALIRNQGISDYHWYILRRKGNTNPLVLIPLLPAMSFNASFVAVGSKIYVFGMINNRDMTSRALSIDCRFHTVQPLPDLPMPIIGRTANIIERKIYVIGECNDKSKKNVMVVFNTETQMWEPEMIELEMEQGHIFSSVVMADKMYMKHSLNSFVYMPKERRWETDKMLNSKWWNYACVVDDILYYYDCCKKTLNAYDRKQSCWSVVKGVGEFLPAAASLPCCPYTVNYGGKLVMFLHRYDESCKTVKIWWAEIVLERRQRGDIRGEVEWCEVFERSLVLQKTISCYGLMRKLFKTKRDLKKCVGAEKD